MAPHTATHSVSYDTPASARLVRNALAPEVGGVDDDRASVSLSRTGDTVAVTVEARDLPALRAGTTSWNRLLTAAERVLTAGAQRF